MDTLTSSTSFLPVHDIQAHVRLMKSFRKLQDDLQPGGIPFNQQSGVPLPSSLTISFVQRAVQRFGVWLNSLNGSGDVLSPFQKEHIPPLDVLMVWYAYMLSPGTYYEDSRNTASALATLGGMPWDKITEGMTPTQEQVTHWEKLTSLPFHPMTSDKPHAKLLNVPHFGTDLVSAVLRQSGSVVRMLAEIKSHESAGNDQWINDAISRYPSFMRLPIGDHVPPVDVDIVWHTHQLSGTRYWDESLVYFGHQIDHDDSQGVEIIRKGRELMKETVDVSKGKGEMLVPFPQSLQPCFCIRAEARISASRTNSEDF
jgi:hypothetical protein